MIGTRILLADDHAMLRQGLRTLLEAVDGFSVIAEAVDGLEAVNLARTQKPNVVILDIGLPRLNGIDAALKIREEKSPPKVVILSMHTERHFIREALKAGVSAYVLKEGAVEELVGAIRTALKGGVYLSPAVANAVADEYVKGIQPGASAYTALSQREREVLQLIAEGKSTKVIAGLLHISAKTIETHRKNLMDKLDLHSVADLTKYAIREGLISLDS